MDCSHDGRGQSSLSSPDQSRTNNKGTGRSFNTPTYMVQEPGAAEMVTVWTGTYLVSPGTHVTRRIACPGFLVFSRSGWIRLMELPAVSRVGVNRWPLIRTSLSGAPGGNSLVHNAAAILARVSGGFGSVGIGSS